MANSTALQPAWTSETAPRRGNPGGFTKNEKRFRKARDREMVPEAIEVLREMLAASRDPEIEPADRQRARVDFLKCCGLIPKQSDATAIRELAEKLLDGMLEEAERRADARREA